MDLPKGSRTTLKPSEDPIKLEQVELVCKVTGEVFTSYEGSLPISKRGWAQLSDEQKYLLNQGVPLDEVLKK